ncbi:MAG: histidinol-phosphate aminotransferase family protein [Candidatus Rokubacteria bacterium]|nr:histidinol-phosphate aminotransferase family protein [Candidatus Rokubacteria bacterium]
MLRPKAWLGGVRRLRNPEGRAGAVRLDKNEHTTGLPAALVRRVLDAMGPEDLAAYPELGGLYAKLAASLGVAVDHLLLTAGSDAAIRAAFDVFVAPGDEVVLLEPTYAMLDVYAGVFGARVVPVRYGADLSLDPAALVAAIGDATRLVAIANPNSPTGTAMPRRDLLAIVEAARRRGVPVLVDEAYHPFHPETVIDRIDACETLMVTRTFSKAYGLAALRIGYVAAAPPLIDLLTRVRPLYEVDGLAAALAAAVLDEPAVTAAYVRDVRDGRAVLARALTRLGLAAPPAAANFQLVRVPDARLRARIRDGLRDKGILIAGEQPPPIDDCLRITLGPPAQMEALAAALKPLVAGGRVVR